MFYLNNNTELNRLEEALRSDEELQKKLKEACKRIAESGEAKNDGEIMVKAAAELGFSITMEDLERAKATSEELSDDELDNVAGGHYTDDEYGNSGACFANYHCHGITRHTDSSSEHTACWSSYLCLTIVEHDECG